MNRPILLAPCAHTLAAAIAIFACASPASATELIFDLFGSSIDQRYGDRVIGLHDNVNNFHYDEEGEGFTPNIEVAYGAPGGDPSLWSFGYGDLDDVLYEDNEGVPLVVKFTADPGHFVKLYRFHVAAFEPFHDNDLVINSVKVFDQLGGELYSATNVPISITTHNTFDFSAAPLTDRVLTLAIDATNITSGFGNEDIGLDDVVFGQAIVPEPASCLILFTGCLALTVGRHRR